MDIAKKLLPTSEKDYKTSEYRKVYAKHILSNIENPILNWDVSIGQFKVSSLFPWKDEFSDIYLRAPLNGKFDEGVLYKKVYELFGNKNNNITEIFQGIMVYVDYIPLGENKGEINSSLDLDIFRKAQLDIKIGHNLQNGLEKFLEISDALGLKTRPFSKTPKIVNYSE